MPSHPLFSRFFRGLALLGSCLAAPGLAAQELTVVSWGGAFARALEEAIIKPFEAETGIQVRMEDYNGMNKRFVAWLLR